MNKYDLIFFLGVICILTSAIMSIDKIILFCKENRIAVTFAIGFILCSIALLLDLIRILGEE